ncbi:MAG: polysaccharide deacetylase family protein [Bacilli bacterium]|nr:polysaccharide deacetylase family protein [Bacilli bacterium]
MSRKRRRKGNTKKKVIFLIVTIILIITISIVCFKINSDRIKELKEQKLTSDILKHYNEYVITNKESNLYKLENNSYLKSGKIAKEEELILTKKEITFKDEYLKIENLADEYYIYYKDIDAIQELSEIEESRYKKYIPFNENIVTKDTTNFYDESDNLIYSIDTSFNLPIIVKKKDIYGIEFNDRLLYVKKEDVSETKENKNTDKKNTSGIAVLNYHFFYDETKASERNDCNQIICKSKSGFKKHLDYIKENNIFTPTMSEFEMYLNKEINLPKSTLITIDDGWRTGIATSLLEEYKLNGTIFLITSWFEEINFLYNKKYVEYHSHGDNLHNQGVCPGGQGGAIKCLAKDKLLADLALSREKLDGSTAFCYPFYEYNSYSIEVLKEAGFTMAFEGGFKKATPSTNKFKIPRYVMYDSTTVSQLKSYIG